MTKQKSIPELIEELKKAVKEKDNEWVHGVYDEIMELIARQADPKLVSKVQKLVGGMDFWYA